MKKLTLPLLSQQDTRWKEITLGYNPPNKGWTIGNYGCLITCLCMYLQKIGKPETPDTLNKKLQENGGYQTGTGLLFWNVFANLYGLKEFYVSPKYTGPLTQFAYDKINDLLNQNLPILAEIDFNPSQEGQQMHYVYIVEYKDGKIYYANDPWSGTNINMDVYGSMDLSVYKFRAYDKPVSSEPVQDDAYFAAGFFELCDIMRIPHNRETAKRELQKLVTYEDEIRKKDGVIEDQKSQLASVKTEATQLREQVNQVSESNTKLTEANTNLKNELETEKQKIVQLNERIDALETSAIPIESKGLIERLLDWLFRR